ncbi:olfactory receptor 11L1-like [Spea bombifrons]|uniref:olfactory receptor 11L1-like n=1 Tax=Spea bombifrons TaxID=233779 RepID=UPI00234A8F0E|nr:olfactory receptor 11L1-like [Spea bombifrons]
MKSENQTVVHDFFLLAFQDIPRFKYCLFVVFLLLYLVTLVGNLLIITTVYIDVHLHNPMYFFLSHLSFSEIVFTTNMVPNMLSAVLHEGTFISISGCIAQFYVFSTSTTAECLLLTAMSYDRYLAICSPLLYSSIMSQRLCLRLAVLCWLSGFFISVISAVALSQLWFCGPYIIDHFFCDLAPILQLSCSDTFFLEMEDFVLSFPVLVFPIVFIVVTYVKIISTILQIPSNTGREKAFSTCSSHLTVVCTYFGTLISIYMAPSSENSFTINKVLSLLYTIVTPLINPFIYSLRSNDIRLSLVKLFKNLKEIGI